jgi:hypothetical protein
VKLKVCGVEDKETRKAVLAAIRKVGYNVQPPSTSAKPKKDEPKGSDVQLVAGPSQPRVVNTMQALVSRLRRKGQDSHAEFHRPHRLKGNGTTI